MNYMLQFVIALGLKRFFEPLRQLSMMEVRRDIVVNCQLCLYCKYHLQAGQEIIAGASIMMKLIIMMIIMIMIMMIVMNMIMIMIMIMIIFRLVRQLLPRERHSLHGANWGDGLAGMI